MVKKKKITKERYVYGLPEPLDCWGMRFCQGCKTLDLVERQKTFTTELSVKSITEYFASSAGTHTEEQPRKPLAIPGVSAPGKLLKPLEQRRVRKRTDPKNIFKLVGASNDLRKRKVLMRSKQSYHQTLYIQSFCFHFFLFSCCHFHL